MPSINNIDKFAVTLNSLGDEARILQERGETLEKVEVPSKEEVEVNPFLVNIEEEDSDVEVPDLTGDLDLFGDSEFLDDEEIEGAPDLVEADDFDIESLDMGISEEEELPEEEPEELSSLDDLSFGEEPEELTSLDGLSFGEEPEELSSLDDLSFGEEPEELSSLDDLSFGDEPEELASLDDLSFGEEPEELSTLDNLSFGEEPEELSTLEDISFDEEPEALSSLDDLSFGDEPEEISTLDDLSFGEESEALSTLDDLSFGDEPEELSSLEGLSFDESPIEELEELSDNDLDTSESLDEDLGIQDIALDDIHEEEPSFDLSIEDEVLEDDFGSLEDEESDEFSLVDFGDTFNLDEDDSSSLLSLDEFTGGEEEEEEVQEELKFAPDEFESIKKTLSELPLNVRIIIEEEIAENGLFGIKLEGLVDLLIREAPLKDIVKYLNKNLGHKIKISSAYAKITAEELERRKKKFSYIFINTVLPKLKWVVPGALGLAMLFLAGYFWGYKIILSEDIYKRGHELILVDRYEEAYDEFYNAFNTHRKMKWYYIYGDTYRERKAFNYSEIIYLQILKEDSSQLEAALKYSTMKGFDQGEYEKATNFLVDYIGKGNKQYNLMVNLGDLYLAWGETNPEKYEDARLWYNEARVFVGNKPPILFKLLNYFIITDKFEEVKFQRRVFEISEDVKVDGDIYARMAGYLMGKGVVEDIRETIFRGLRDNPRNPNLHYQLARYFISISDDVEGEKALRKAIFYYSYGGELTKEELSNLVDAKRMMGEMYLKQERYLASEDNYQDAVTLYENLVERNLVERESRYGEIYAGYGDIFYYGGNSLGAAYNLYSRAEENNFSDKELSYKKGYIKYREKEYEDSLIEFHKSEDSYRKSIPVLIAKANTFFFRGSFNSALTYYEVALDYLLDQEEEIGDLYPRENDQHLAIYENYIRLYNNIGVTLYKLYGDKVIPEAGLNFTRSTEYYDHLTRDPELLIRSESRDLAYYNNRAILYPEQDVELYIYNSISKDFEDFNLGVVTKVNYGSK